MKDGRVYDLYVATYHSKLAPNTVSPASLLQVYLDEAANNDTLVGLNGEYHILAAAQAVQTTNFDAVFADGGANAVLNKAFKEIASDNHPWMADDAFADDSAPSTGWYDNPDPQDPNLYTLSTAGDLAGLAQLVNSGNTFTGKTIRLANDIDLKDMEWTPIGASDAPFSGTFDGSEKTIRNLRITKDQNYAGLFGYTTTGEIKNLIIENAYMTCNSAVGVVAGSPGTSKYTNITVKGLIQVNGCVYVGGVAGYMASADWTNVRVIADEGSYVHAESGDYRTYAGGVIGFMGPGTVTKNNSSVSSTIVTMKDIQSNIDVYGSTRGVGGIVGFANWGNVFENCSSSGDVTITSGKPEEIGGIAGVWMNSYGYASTTAGNKLNDPYRVAFTDCTYTGVLSVTESDGTVHTDFSSCNSTPQNHAIVGHAYTPGNGYGTLIIDGVQAPN